MAKMRRIYLALFICILLILEYAAVSKIMGAYYFNLSRTKSDDMNAYINYLKKALAFDSSNGLIHHTLARAFMMQDRYPEALAEVQKGFKSFTSPGVYKQLGSIYYSLDDPERAKEAFRKVLYMDTSDQESLERLAMICLFRKEFDEARQYITILERYHLRNPNRLYIEAMYYDLKGESLQALLYYYQTLYAPTAGLESFIPLFKKGDIVQRMKMLEAEVLKKGS